MSWSLTGVKGLMNWNVLDILPLKPEYKVSVTMKKISTDH